MLLQEKDVDFEEIECNKLVSLKLLLNHVELRNSINGYYLELLLQNSRSKIEAKLWNSSKEEFNTYSSYIGKIVLVTAKRQIYRSKSQMILSTIKPTGDNIDEYIKKSPCDIGYLRKKISYYIDKIEDITLNTIIKKLLSKYDKEFFSYPAATKIHHDFMHGLVHHTVYMLRIAETLSDIYEEINISYLYSGIILHDLGKIFEMEGIVNSSYTNEGMLIGHINIIFAEIALIVKDLEKDSGVLLNTESILILKHLVLSHHGKHEYGSPKLPMIFEAEILSFIDNLDAKIEIMRKHLANIPKGSFTDRIQPLEGRIFYKPKTDPKVLTDEDVRID